MDRLIQTENRGKSMIFAELFAEHGGKIVSGGGASFTLIMGWCYMKIKQQCGLIIELKKNKVEKEIYEAEKKTHMVQFDGLQAEITEMKTDNKEAHGKLFEKLDDVLFAVRK